MSKHNFVVIITWVYPFNRAIDLRFSLKWASFVPPDHLYIWILEILSEERVSIIIVIITWIYHFFHQKNSVNAKTKKRLILLLSLNKCLHLLVRINISNWPRGSSHGGPACHCCWCRGGRRPSPPGSCVPPEPPWCWSLGASGASLGLPAVKSIVIQIYKYKDLLESHTLNILR